MLRPDLSKDLFKLCFSSMYQQTYGRIGVGKQDMFCNIAHCRSLLCGLFPLHMFFLNGSQSMHNCLGTTAKLV